MLGILIVTALGIDAGLAGADTVSLTLSATIDANGTTILVVAPGCQPSPPGCVDIVVRSRNPVTGEIGEGAVGVGVFSAPDHGQVTLPGQPWLSPAGSYLLQVTCNGGALTAQQVITFAAPEPATPVTTQPSFTG